VAALVPLIAGILSHEVLPAKPVIWLGCVAALLLIAMWRLGNDVLSSVLLAGAIFFVGVAAAQLELLFFPANHVGFFTSGDQQLANVEMKIVAPPRIVMESAEHRTLPPKQVMTAEVTAVETRAGWQKVSGRIVATGEPPVESLAAGQTIRALGWLSRPMAPTNPGEFDLSAYYRRQRILAEFRIRRSASIEVVSDSGPSILVRLRQKARNLLGAGFPTARAIDASFLQMLLLGDSNSQLNEVREEYQSTGTAYQLSISGLHIAILGGFVLLVLRLLRVGPDRAVWISLLFVAIYAALVLPSQTGLRALLVCAAGGIGLLLRRASDGLQLLAVAVGVILLIHPADLYDAGFQIGAAAVLGLILFSRSVSLVLVGMVASDEPIVGAKPKVGVLKSIALFAGRTMLASGIIWVCVLPLVVFYFQQVSPWAVPGGLVLLPLTIVALLAGAGKILLTLLCPWLNSWWAMGAVWPTELLLRAVGELSHLPMTALSASAPRWWMFLIYYGLLLLPLIPWKRNASRWMARLAWIPACVLLLAVPPAAPGALAAPSQSGGVHLTFLDIGAGQTALVRVSGGTTFFADCGSTTVSDVYRRVIEPYLRHEGVRRVDGIFLSHGDYDHISAAEEIIDAYRVPAVYLTPYFRTHAVPGAATALLELLDKRGPPPTLVTEGATVDVGGGAKLEILWPPVNCRMNSNDCGMVMKLVYAGKSILFTADIQVAPEVELLRHPEKLKADVLIAPHHGSAESSTAAFLRAVNPKMIICSNGFQADGKLTAKQMTFDRIARGWAEYRTSEEGEIDLTIAGDGTIGISEFLQQARSNKSGLPVSSSGRK
jgi:competence protein ComEC